MKQKKTVKYIDLFAGLGGIRLGFMQAFENAGYQTECVLTSEIKPSAVKALTTNFKTKMAYLLAKDQLKGIKKTLLQWWLLLL